MENTVIGTDLEINVGKNYKGKLGVSGKSEQATRSGNNKFDISKATKASGSCSFKNNGDSIDITTTCIGGYISANIDITDLFKEGETIYAKANFVASSSNTGAYRIQWSEDSGLTKGDIVLMSSTSDSVKSGVVPTKPEGATKLLLYLYGNVEGTVAIGDTVTYSKIMLSNQPITDYEEYGAMPSPDFPSEIKNVTGEINKYYIPNSGKITSNGITATYTKNTSEVILDGVATGNFSDSFEIKNILLKKGTYSVSVWGLNKTNEEFDRFFVADKSNNNKVIVNYVQSYRTQKFTLEQDTNIRLTFTIKAGSTYSNTKVKIMINEGDIGLSYIPYNSLKIRKTGKNILSDNKDDYNGSIYGYIKLLNNFENNNLVLSIEDNDKSIDMTGINFGVTGNEKNWDDKGIWLLYDGKKVRNSISTNKYPFFSFYPNNQTTFDKIFKRYKIQAEISKGIVPTEFEKYKSNSWIFPLEPGQKLYEGSYLAEDGIHNRRTQIKLLSSSGGFFVSALGNYQVFGKTQKGVKGKSRLLSNYFKDYGSVNAIKDTVGIANDSTADRIYVSNGISTTLDEFKDWLNKCENAGRPVIVEYELAEEEIIPYTQEQQNAFYKLQNIVLYDGINHISTDNELGSMSIEVSKIIEDYETYISSNGFFINSQNDIHYLIDFSESELPCMAEATETTVKAAGRNGDIVLSTTYDPNNFNIVCYTEDNLTQEEKVKEEMKLKKLLNSIKNKTIPLAFEKDDKFYKVKYSGAFSSTNFPKHLKFSIPLKTSESYGKDLIKKVIFGNGEETSDTFEDVGAIFTIKGPANSPIISLNDYSIEYDNPLLEGDKLIINSSNSTITHINSDGVKTNAMRYYNHQFPKIENGKNVLKVLSGVNEANVSVEWYDYKF